VPQQACLQVLAPITLAGAGGALARRRVGMAGARGKAACNRMPACSPPHMSAIPCRRAPPSYGVATPCLPAALVPHGRRPIHWQVDNGCAVCPGRLPRHIARRPSPGATISTLPWPPHFSLPSSSAQSSSPFSQGIVALRPPGPRSCHACTVMRLCGSWHTTLTRSRKDCSMMCTTGVKCFGRVLDYTDSRRCGR
jgi:hypothetical protein